MTFVLASCSSVANEQSSLASGWDPLADWAVQPGFSINVDSRGYHFPTSIAFVPNPGSDPKDPLYFVTELRGTIKVVTNDRSVLIFSDDIPALDPIQELPHATATNGLAGICLAPDQGYVFVTYTFEKNSALHNSIIRYQTKLHTLSVTSTSQIEFDDIFADDVSGSS
ncbi:MAG TPA: beta-propeller fold lactonase family protein, partial [Anaerolineales bacterium]